jgi:hypothetical protein
MARSNSPVVAMRARENGVDQLTWLITDGQGGQHRIEVAKPTFMKGPSRSFICDGEAYSLGRMIQRGPRVASLEIAGRAAQLEMRGVMPRAAVRFRRALGGSLRPRTFLAFLFGAGVGGGMAGASAASSLLVWTIYTLSVDAADQGSWVIRSVGGVVEAITFVRPGGSLPDGTSELWPAKPPSPASRPAHALD